MSSCSSHFSASNMQSVGFGVELRWPYCVIVYTSSRVPNGFTHSCVNICLTIFTWWLHTAVISSQTSSHYSFFGKHIFLDPVAFKLGRVLLANLVQYNQYYIWNGLKWSYLSCDYNPCLSGMQTGALILSSIGTEFAFCPHQKFYWGNEYDKLSWHLGPVVSAYL